MGSDEVPGPTILAILGIGGDLARRKLVPALFDLFVDRCLPERFAVLGLDRPGKVERELLARLGDGAASSSRDPGAAEASWPSFVSRLALLPADFADPGAYERLADACRGIERGWGAEATVVVYLAVPPSLFASIVRGLGRAGYGRATPRARIVLEKPFGRDLASARELDATLAAVFDEQQVFRIDHYLGKETVQNILVFRFANALFEPVWDRRYIQDVQVTVGEELGVEHRAGYYEQAGALRDMVQSHLFQLMKLIAMEPPVSFAHEDVRDRKRDVLRAVRRVPPDEVHRFAVRGQYGPGWLEGSRVPGYREEPGVGARSSTETFAAVRLFVDNWRWQDVPFYLRTGKRLARRVTEISIQFRPVPHQAFPRAAIADFRPNRLTINIQPTEGIVLRFQAKVPGRAMRLSPARMRFAYPEAFPAAPRIEAYATLLLDVMLGDPTLFTRADEAEAAWEIVAPILDAWEAAAPVDFPDYAAGTWGPDLARTLAAQDGNDWLSPVVLDEEE